MYEDMLVVPGYDVLEEKESMGRITREQHAALSATFGNVARNIRQLGINAMPDYEYIIDQLSLMQALYREHPSPASGGNLTGSGIWTRTPVVPTTMAP